MLNFIIVFCFIIGGINLLGNVSKLDYFIIWIFLMLALFFLNVLADNNYKYK